jgi:hypothetical protein
MMSRSMYNRLSCSVCLILSYTGNVPKNSEKIDKLKELKNKREQRKNRDMVCHAAQM